MPLQWWYEAEVNGTSEEITDRVRLYQMQVTSNAEEGSVATSSVVIDDPDGDYDIVGWRRIRAFEDTATGSNTHIYSGFVADRTVHREMYRTGAGRQWVVNMVDENTVLSLRVLTQSDANRPAETDVARITWLLGELGTPNIPVTEFFNTSGAVSMDAVDYRGQTRYDVINDCAQASGKNFFVYTRDTSFFDLDLGFWYDYPDSTEYSSIIRLSNDLDDVLGDASGFTREISLDTELNRDPSRIYSGAYVRYDGGAVIEESITTSNNFTRRDGIVPADNVKTQAKATARALRYLSEMDTEEDRITTAFRLPANRVNFVKPGMRCQFRATHLPGYEGAFAWLRVLRRTVRQDSEEEYLVTLELGTGPSSIEPVTPVGEGSLYLAADNTTWPGENIFINGTAVGVNGANIIGDRNVRRPVAEGILTSGDNVIAVGIINGHEPISWFGGNFTALVLRLHLGTDDSGPAVAYTSTSTKVWPIENDAGTLGGEPSGWQNVGFDDSGWDNAVDVGPFDSNSGPATSLDDQHPATAPSIWAGPPLAPSDELLNTYARDLIWLARIHFTI